MDLLSRREHSRVELQRKLLLRGAEVDEIQPVLEKLAQDNLLSDSRFAECYVRARAAKGYGPQRIRLELAERGVQETLIDKALTELTSEQWQENLHQVWKKRFKGQFAETVELRAKQLSFLQYRGFELDQIRRVLSEKQYE